MKNYARLVSDVAIDVSTDPANHFHPEIAAQFIEVPPEVKHGWRAAAGKWSPPPPPVQAEPPAPKLAPIQVKMLFTAGERAAAKASSNPAVTEFFALLDDPRLEVVDLGLRSTREALDDMEADGILADGRKEQVLAGVIV